MPESQSIWATLKSGDPSALLGLYKEHYLGLMNYGLKMSGDRSFTRDCITQMLLNLHRQCHKLPDVTNVRSYLLTSLRNEMLAEIRLDMRRAAHLWKFDRSVEVECSYEEMLVSQQTEDENRKRLTNAMANLTEREKELLRRRYFEDQSYDDIAASCGITKRTAYNIVNGALKRLKIDLLQQSTNKFAYFSLMNVLAAGFI